MSRLTVKDLAALDAELYASVSEIRVQQERALSAGFDAGQDPHGALHAMYAAVQDVISAGHRAENALNQIRDHYNSEHERRAA